MSRLATWVAISIGGFAYWGIAHGFAPDQINHAAAPIWFGGVALFTHWITNIGGTP